MNKGKLYLIPTSLGNNDLKQTLTAPVFEAINNIDNYIVENIKSAVQFLKLAGIKKRVQQLNFEVLNVDTKDGDINEFVAPALNGKDIGLLSEAGVPCIADPGAKIVSIAHENNIKVIPLTGPSSIILALMASGLNGQNFAFNGYLPIDKKERKIKLMELQKLALNNNQAQIFIEAPHRNDHLLNDMLDIFSPKLRLCVAIDITLPNEYINTKPVELWRKNKITIGKHPAIFILGK
jgi:16S rRNA (cytidine1402-2'-O)-methyltransferase